EILDLVCTHKFNDRLNAAGEALFGWQGNVPGVGTAYWFAAVGYLSYQMAPRLTGNVRLELFDDPQGQRTGSPGLYTAATAGVSWRPTPFGLPPGSLVVRPELRFDDNDESRPFEGRHAVLTATLDVYLRY